MEKHCSDSKYNSCSVVDVQEESSIGTVVEGDPISTKSSSEVSKSSDSSSDSYPGCKDPFGDSIDCDDGIDLTTMSDKELLSSTEVVSDTPSVSGIEPESSSKSNDFNTCNNDKDDKEATPPQTFEKEKFGKKVAEVIDLYGKLFFKKMLHKKAKFCIWNGIVIWKLTDITQHRIDARKVPFTFIESPPFCTISYGHELCLRVYLDGDEHGHGCHLSVCVVVLKKGLCPLPHKCSLVLLDQDDNNDIQHSFDLSAGVTSCKQDSHELVKCTQFADLNVFDGSCYLKNDAMFLKCVLSHLS